MIKKKILFVFIIIGFVFIQSSRLIAANVTANKEKTIKVEEYLLMLEKAIGKKGTIKIGNLLKEEIIKRVDAAVLTNRAERIKNGLGYNQKLYKQVVLKKRIADIKKIEKGKRYAVRKCLIKGLMIGYSKGDYSQSREFKGNNYLTVEEAKEIIVRLKDKTQRKKLSSDGQVIRTTNLPKNEKDYPYILESFPNSFYEYPYCYASYQKQGVNQQILKQCKTPVSLRKSYYNSGKEKIQMKKILEEQLDRWCILVERNLNTRLNFHYQTVSNKWINELRSTYQLFNIASEDRKLTDKIYSYQKNAKENKVIIKAEQIVVEPSSLYEDALLGYMIRCYIKFQTNIDKQNELIFGKYNTNIKNLEKEKWLEGYVDLSIRGITVGAVQNTEFIGMDRICIE